MHTRAQDTHLRMDNLAEGYIVKWAIEEMSLKITCSIYFVTRTRLLRARAHYNKRIISWQN